MHEKGRKDFLIIWASIPAHTRDLNPTKKSRPRQASALNPRLKSDMIISQNGNSTKGYSLCEAMGCPTRESNKNAFHLSWSPDRQGFPCTSTWVQIYIHAVQRLPLSYLQDPASPDQQGEGKVVPIHGTWQKQALLSWEEHILKPNPSGFPQNTVVK